MYPYRLYKGVAPLGGLYKVKYIQILLKIFSIHQTKDYGNKKNDPEQLKMPFLIIIKFNFSS